MIYYFTHPSKTSVESSKLRWIPDPCHQVEGHPQPPALMQHLDLRKIKLN
jgi:hypothetical protein